MKKTKLIIGVHGHTPFGSSEEDFERAYQTQYKPFISSLYRYPTVPVVLSYSGVLLAWLELRHPEYFLIIEELINRKQVEVLGGGFYEPMMPLLPLADRLGQIELLTTYLRKHFGKRPRGCWLPGLVWEQPLAATLQTCGMDYTFLESCQFQYAGLSGADLERPCLTEDQGKIITVFPISRRLTEALLSRDFSSFLSAAEQPAGNGDERVLTVFVEGFFDGGGGEAAFCEFLEVVSAPNEKLELTVPSRALKSAAVKSKSYFPSSAQWGVMYWAMEEERRRDFDAMSGRPVFTPGALPRQFLVRYPEANGIYTKMLYAHILINQLRGDKYRKRAAREELWKAQGCDGFWHVADGGLYRNGVRKAVYGALIEAEKITREKGVFIPSVIPVDLNLDGEREFLLQGTELNCYVKIPGGALFELDYLPKPWNYVDTLRRRREPYAPADQVVDRLPRCAFADRLLHPEAALKDAVLGSFPASRDCSEERYEEVSVDRVHQELSLCKPADFQGPYGDIEICKKYSLKKNVMTVFYTLVNRGAAPQRFNLAPAIELSFSGEGPGQRSIGVVRDGKPSSDGGGPKEHRGVDELVVEDLRNSIPVSLSSVGRFDVWAVPIRTVCRIDGVVEECYQSDCFMPVVPVVLAAGERWETRFVLRLGR